MDAETIFQVSLTRKNSFATYNATDIIPLGAHNVDNAPDDVRTVSINGRYRRFITDLIEQYVRRISSQLDDPELAAFEQNIQTLYDDFFIPD